MGGVGGVGDVVMGGVGDVVMGGVGDGVGRCSCWQQCERLQYMGSSVR